MTRQKKDPLRTLTEEERTWLERISRAQSEPASHVARAKEILAVAEGHSYTEAAQIAGRKSGDSVSQLIERFNEEGLEALQLRHGGGPEVKYSVQERERVLAEARRQPDPEKDGTKTWSLTTLQKALQKRRMGYPRSARNGFGLSCKRRGSVGRNRAVGVRLGRQPESGNVGS